MISKQYLPLLWYLGFNFFHTNMQIFVKLLSYHFAAQYVIIIRSILLLTLNTIILLNSHNYKPYNHTTHT